MYVCNCDDESVVLYIYRSRVSTDLIKKKGGGRGMVAYGDRFGRAE